MGGRWTGQEQLGGREHTLTSECIATEKIRTPVERENTSGGKANSK